MKIELVKHEKQITRNWSGGKTTQLAIFPEEGSYEERHFDWRLSTAVVEEDNSTFTHLPGIDRILMIIKGSIRIEHKGKYSKILTEYEQDAFNGNWITNSYGKATDFNLMLRKPYQGNLEKLTIYSEEELAMLIKRDNYLEKTDVFYCTSGKITITIENSYFELNEKDMLILNSNDDKSHEVFAKNQSEFPSIMIHAQILGTVNKI